MSDPKLTVTKIGVHEKEIRLHITLKFKTWKEAAEYYDGFPMPINYEWEKGSAREFWKLWEGWAA